MGKARKKRASAKSPKKRASAKTSQKRASWRELVFGLLLIVGWAGYRLYQDHERDGGWKSVNVSSVLVAGTVAVIIVCAVFWYVRRPDRETEP